VLGADDAPTGVVFHTESAIAPLLEALRASGRRVPQDVSVVAICPDAMAEQARPRLTSVHMPAEELGRRAVELLMHKLGGDAATGATLLEPRLTARDSDAPVAPTPPG
jgi:DNA-binding LacI/PurR family transcriptional regulator